MEEVGAQVAQPMFTNQTLSSRFCDASSMSKKRDLSYQIHNFQLQQQQQHRFVQNSGDNWNPKAWEWDSVKFIAKPVDADVLQLGTLSPDQKRKYEVSGNHSSKKNSNLEVVDDSLRLNLGGSLTSVEEPVSRPNKRVRSGSPGSSTYPMCQVDNCKEDLSNAKDYHRRHKVCEVHSKSTKALVGKQMQRFCQQCSRFHPLSEFDEGKRSCRRRLAGHNRRRRKTQPEDVSSGLLLPENRDMSSNGNLDIVNLLTTLASHNQGKNGEKGQTVPDREQLIQIINKINTLPLPTDLAAKLSSIGSLSRINAEFRLSQLQKRLNGVSSASSTMDLLTVLSATLATSAPDALAILSQRSSQSSDSGKSKAASPDHATGSNVHKQPEAELPSTGGERSSSCYNSPAEDSDCQIQETRPNLPLQLFSSSPETDSPPKLAASRKYFSSDSSNIMEDGSPSSSPPVVQKLFPLKSTDGTLKSEKMSTSREGNANGQSNGTQSCILPLELFSQSNREAEHSSFKNLPYQAGYTSSSGSDHSPSSQNSDARDRTGRIIFKLFDKDPSHLPGTLRTQIYNWLSNCPSEMESYIRPGCVVLSVYLSMPSTAWQKLERNLLKQVDLLAQDPELDIWRSGRFLLNTGRQLASHKDGKNRLFKSWRTWSSPELMSVSPVAVVSGQETSLLLKGRNLSNPGTRVHCTYMGGYESKEVTAFCYPGSSCNEINIDGFKIPGETPSALGRCFIEVENCFKGNSFPVIIADSSICKELRLLESEFDLGAQLPDIASEEQANYTGLPRSREEVLHFLNELGWLFQRRSQCPMPELQDYSLVRFKFLLIFSVERDYCVLVKTILGMLVERNMKMDGLSKESLETLSEVQLLNRAVKRRCRKMIDLLTHYSIAPSDCSPKYIFPPNLVGPGGITPLHLAACASTSEALVDSLTNDPQEIGLFSWDTLLDANGMSPYAYAVMTNNHSYNALVARKLADRRNGQVSVTIGNEMVQRIISQPLQRGRTSCAKCATVSAKFQGRIRGSHALLHRPYIHSMLAIAAVCVCVCLFLRGAPDIGSVAPFKWENLDFGTI